MRKRIVGIVSLCVLFIAYCIFRYLLFEWHGMKEFPLYLLFVGVIVITISGIIQGNRIAPIFTAIGYIAGFFVAYLLAVSSYDPGGGARDDMWIIWMSSYGTTVVAGILIEVFNRKKHKR